MAQRQHLDAGADLDAAGAGGNGTGHGQRCGQHGTRRLLVDLGEPDRVQPPAFRVGDLLERHRERIRVGLTIHLAVELMVPTEFHGDSVAFGTCERNA